METPIKVQQHKTVQELKGIYFGNMPKNDDFNVALLAYDINDCISNVVKVPKEQIGCRLFGNNWIKSNVGKLI